MVGGRDARPLVPSVGAALLSGVLAGAGVFACSVLSLRLAPGIPSWSRLAGGVASDGALRDRALVLLPGLPPGGWALTVEAEGADGAPAEVGLRPDPATLLNLRTSRGRPEIVLLPPRSSPGARLEILPGPNGPVRLLALGLRRTGPAPWAPALAALLVTAGLVAVLCRRLHARAALALGLSFAGLVVLSRVPMLLYLAVPEPAAVARVAVPWALLAAGATVAWAEGMAGRRRWLVGTALLGALVFGAWVRGYFLPSTGSWDTEYWKAWMLRAASSGVSQVYGGPDAVPPGHVLAQVRGEEELWKVDFGSRAFVVDYPPLAMAAWRWSWWLVSRRSGLDHAEAQSVAVKLPAVLGDVAAVLVLLWGLRRSPGRGAAMAALYWALPVSWLSSGVLGYLDGALAPLVALSLAAAGSGQPAIAGAALAAGALIKPTAAIVAPAVLVALLARGSSWVRAVVAGLAAVAAALLPFALAGTLTTAVVHVYRILFQGTLSGGYPNPWWVLGHALTAEGQAGWLGAVRYARLDAIPFPARTAGTALFALWAAFVAWRHHGVRGPRPAALAGAALVYGYGMLAVGVHENHPHALVLLFLATGLPGARLKALAAAAGGVYVVNMLVLSGLGRFHGLRYAAIEPLSRGLAALRLAPGFDLTLLLAVVNVAAFLYLAVHLRAEMEGLAEDVEATAVER